MMVLYTSSLKAENKYQIARGGIIWDLDWFWYSKQIHPSCDRVYGDINT